MDERQNKDKSSRAERRHNPKEIDERISFLGREATRLKGEGAIDKAILCLEEVWVLIHDFRVHHGAQPLIRLPMYLQYAGRFSEAEVRFQEILTLAPRYAMESAQYHDLSGLYAPFIENHFIHDVYDAMRIAYKRQKMADLSEKYHELAKKYLVIAEGFGKQLDAVRKKQLDEHRAWCEKMRSLYD